MKHVLSDRIILADDSSDNRFLFRLPANLPLAHRVDMAELLAPYRDESIDHRRDYKLWDRVYSREKELEVFRELVDRAITTGGRVHIDHVSLTEEIAIVRELYQKLGYFDIPTNRFWPDFAHAPVTIGVNIRNLVYSTKDYKSKRDAICFVPPPRSPGDVKAFFAGINSGVVSTITVNDIEREDDILRDIVTDEKTSLLHLSNALYWNYEQMGVKMEAMEWMLQ